MADNNGVVYLSPFYRQQRMHIDFYICYFKENWIIN